jgi:hypothetical protein
VATFLNPCLHLLLWRIHLWRNHSIELSSYYTIELSSTSATHPEFFLAELHWSETPFRKNTNTGPCNYEAKKVRYLDRENSY